MDKIDLRLQFKSETGELPVWPKQRYSNKDAYENMILVNGRKIKVRSYSYYGNLKGIYGMWLEEHFDNISSLRTTFHIETFYEPSSVYSSNKRKYKQVYSTVYSEWLEEQVLEMINQGEYAKS